MIKTKGMIFILSLKRVELADEVWIKPLLEQGDPQGSHLNFVNLFLWQEVFKYGVGQVGDFLIVKAQKGADPCYFYPQGTGNLKSVLELLQEDALAVGHPFSLAGLSPENIRELEGFYPGKFNFEPMRDAFDYVYLLEKMVTLAGKKLHAKRNHINYFKRVNNWELELINRDNFLEMREMNDIWCQIYGVNEDGTFKDETCAVTRALNNYEELGLEGALIRSDGRVIAYTVGEVLNSNTYVIHIEKAFGDIRGAYQMINREFAALVQQKYPHLVYINREEDMGFSGLRKAKLSYYPVKMVEKHWGTFR
ncbi:MAG: phosphatidylglycerol lysyltransferase domain-containing protein [Bacillota bacterium]